MRTILYLVRKEFIQIMRDKFLRVAIIMIPVVQMLILVYAATFEMKNNRIFFIDQDRSSESVLLTEKFRGSGFFIVSGYSFDLKEAESSMLKGKTDVICIIPADFGKDLNRQKGPSVQLLLNSINSSLAELTLAYSRNILLSFSKDYSSLRMPSGRLPGVEIRTRNWYNPEMDYKIFMAPGILVILVTAIGWIMTGMNLVKEKERGTIEQLNVTPVKKYQFIAGKLLPFLLIGLFDLAFGLVIAKIFFRIPFEGSLLTLFSFAAVYLVAVLGIGLFISTISNTQQQVLFISFFFVMIFILMGGIFTSVENMPAWGRKINIINPVAYFIKVIRMILLKGSGFADISKEIISIAIYAVFTNTLAIWSYRKRV